MSGSDPVRPPASDVRLTYDLLEFPDDGRESPLFPGLTLRLSDIFEE